MRYETRRHRTYFKEDYSAAVDYIGLLSYVDRERIGAVGICGLSGMAVTAAGTDTRMKAVASFSMYRYVP